MGTINHNAIIVTSWRSESINKAIGRAQLLFSGSMVSSITSVKVNEYYSFMVGPDGSKEGWGNSNLYDSRRENFCDYLKQMNANGECIDFVEISYGEYGVRIERFGVDGQNDAS